MVVVVVGGGGGGGEGNEEEEEDLERPSLARARSNLAHWLVGRMGDLLRLRNVANAL